VGRPIEYKPYLYNTNMWLMPPEAQTTTRGSLAISAGALEIATVSQGDSEVFSLYFISADSREATADESATEILKYQVHPHSMTRHNALELSGV